MGNKGAVLEVSVLLCKCVTLKCIFSLLQQAENLFNSIGCLFNSAPPCSFDKSGKTPSQNESPDGECSDTGCDDLHKVLVASSPFSEVKIPKDLNDLEEAVDIC